MRSSARGLLTGFLAGVVLAVGGTVAYLASERFGAEARGDSPGDGDGLDFLESVRVPAVALPSAPKVIYLNREGATLVAGDDDASQNRSSVVRGAGLSRAVVPAFAGAPRRWNEIVECVRSRFAPFDVAVVDQRPIGESYVMAMVGGTADVLEGGHGAEGGHDHASAAGLAPFSGEPVGDAVVFVFSRKLRENARRTCEVASMEVAHAYGLDHAMHCGELMSYLRPCGRRSFRDDELPCGEHEARPCEGASGGDTQNSYRRLLSVLGPAAE